MIHQPILLIHGFNGAPSNWTGPADRFPEFLAAHGYDPTLIRVFSYGDEVYNGKRTYNNLGDIRQIAHRLDQADSDDPETRAAAVDRLSQDSVARGGPAGITIIAHSSGGLVARYYLTRRIEDAFGTRYRGNVARVIFLGTPHQGVDVEDLLDPLPTNLLIYRMMVRVHYLFPPEYHEQAQTLRGMFNDLKQATQRELLVESDPGEVPAFKEMHPGSKLLTEINQPGAMPQETAYYNIIGDVRAGLSLEWRDRVVFERERSFGDLLVSTASAGVIPNARSQTTALVETHCLQVDATRHLSRLVRLTDAGAHPTPIHRHLRSLPAARERILEILADRR